MEKIRSLNARNEARLKESEARLAESKKCNQTMKKFCSILAQYRTLTRVNSPPMLVRTTSDRDTIMVYTALDNIVRTDPNDGRSAKIEQVVTAFGADPIAAAAWLSREGEKLMKQYEQDILKNIGRGNP